MKNDQRVARMTSCVGTWAAVLALSACARSADRVADSARADSLRADSLRTAIGTPVLDPPAIDYRALPPFTVSEFGIGAPDSVTLHPGTPYKAANDSLHGALVAARNANLAECDYVTWRGAPPGVLVMVSADTIARIDVDSTGVRTREGAQVGDSEASVLALYKGRIAVTPHKYSDGHYLTVTPVISSPTDTLFRLIFETENGRVTRFRTGVRPAVEYVEGCS